MKRPLQLIQSTILAIFILILISRPLYSQIKCNLLLEGETLKGECNHKLFTGIEIKLGKKLDQLDSTTIFQSLPL